MLQNSCNQYTFSHKKYILQNCNNLATLFHLQNVARVVSLAKNAIFARNNLSLNTLRSGNLCISPKSKHNQPLEVKCDELCTC